MKQKILHKPELKITSTCVKVPALNCHNESINIELKRPLEINDIFNYSRILRGIKVFDNINELKYPTHLMVSEKMMYI